MKKRLFENYSKSDRIQALKDNAEKSEDFSYFREYQPEELDLVKDQYFQDVSELQNHEELLKEAKETFKTNADPLKKRMQENLVSIRTKGRYVSETVYLLADHEAGMMEYYNDMGEMVHSRRMLPDERQLRIKIGKTGTNN